MIFRNLKLGDVYRSKSHPEWDFIIDYIYIRKLCQEGSIEYFISMRVGIQRINDKAMKLKGIEPQYKHLDYNGKNLNAFISRHRFKKEDFTGNFEIKTFKNTCLEYSAGLFLLNENNKRL